MPRDYKSEYENYHSKPEQKKDRAGRNGARRMLKKKYGNSLLGKDVDHKDKDYLQLKVNYLQIQIHHKLQKIMIIK